MLGPLGSFRLVPPSQRNISLLPIQESLIEERLDPVVDGSGAGVV